MENLYRNKSGSGGERIKQKPLTRPLDKWIVSLENDWVFLFIKKSLLKYLDYFPDVYIYSWIDATMLEMKSFDTEIAKGTNTVMKGLQT